MPTRSDSVEDGHLAAVAADRATVEAAYESLQVALLSAKERVLETLAAERCAVKAVAAHLQRDFSKQQQQEDVDEAMEEAAHDCIIADAKQKRSAAAAERLMRRLEQKSSYESRKAALLAKGLGSAVASDPVQPAIGMARGISASGTPASLPAPTAAPAARPAAQSSDARQQVDVQAADIADTAIDPPPREPPRCEIRAAAFPALVASPTPAPSIASSKSEGRAPPAAPALPRNPDLPEAATPARMALTAADHSRPASLAGNGSAPAHVRADQQPHVQVQPQPQLQLLQEPLSTRTDSNNLYAQRQGPRLQPRPQVKPELTDLSQIASRDLPSAARPGSPGVAPDAHAAHPALPRSLAVRAVSPGQAPSSLAPFRMHLPGHVPLLQATSLPPHSCTEGNRAGGQETLQQLSRGSGSGSGKATSPLDIGHVHDRRTPSSNDQQPSSNNHASCVGPAVASGTATINQSTPIVQKRKRQRTVRWSEYDYEVLEYSSDYEVPKNLSPASCSVALRP